MPANDWEKIRREWETTDVSGAALARKYGLSQTAIQQHKKKEQWSREGSPALPPAPEAQPVPKGEAAAKMSERKVDEEIAKIAADLVAEPEPVDPRDERIAELEKELAEFKPLDWEWPFTTEKAASLLSDRLHDMVEQELITLNRQRAANGLAPFTVAEMETREPGWFEKEKTKIITETVDALTRYATNDGPAKTKLAMLKPNGVNVMQIELAPGMDNGGEARVAKLKGRGWQELAPRVCWRWDCWGPSKEAWNGHCSELHQELYAAFVGKAERGVTTTATFNV